MRVELPGVSRVEPPFTFNFEGRTITAYPGETIAAALMAAEQWSLRDTRFGDQRGVFCGMGVCGECLVLVDGVTRRACQEPVVAGLKVRRHPARSPCAPSATIAIRERPDEVLKPDVLIVGAGPAGLAAAKVISSASLGSLDVLVLDERKSAGGQYFKQPARSFAVCEEELDAQFREGRELVASVAVSGVTLISEATVWGAFVPMQIGAITPTRRLTIQPRRLVLACGAYERGVPFPGWTLPGVMTTGAAQTLLRSSQIAPGRRVLIAGNGPLNLQVARELSDCGVEVVALVEAAATLGPSSLGALMKMAMSSPRLVSDGATHLWALRRRNVPVLYRHALVRAEGAERVEEATIAQINHTGQPVAGTERNYKVDAMCVGYGFLPQSELARALGCRHHYEEARGGLIVERDDAGRTSIPEVFVIGDAGGLGGARIALSQGALAGLAVARDLGLRLGADLQRQEAKARRTLARYRRFQQGLWSLYRAPLLIDQLATPDTYICRCEGVTQQALETLMPDADALGPIKRGSRAGMGRCQGRYCGPIIAEILRRSSGKSLKEKDLLAPRPPFRPLPIGSLVIQDQQ